MGKKRFLLLRVSHLTADMHTFNSNAEREISHAYKIAFTPYTILDLLIRAENELLVPTSDCEKVEVGSKNLMPPSLSGIHMRSQYSIVSITIT